MIAQGTNLEPSRAPNKFAAQWPRKAAPLSQLPPRRTRRVPAVGHSGQVQSPAKELAAQSGGSPRMGIDEAMLAQRLLARIGQQAGAVPPLVEVEQTVLSSLGEQRPRALVSSSTSPFRGRQAGAVSPSGRGAGLRPDGPYRQSDGGSPLRYGTRSTGQRAARSTRPARPSVASSASRPNTRSAGRSRRARARMA